MAAEPVPQPPPKPCLPVEKQWLQDVINKEYGTSATLLDTDCEIIGEGQGFLSVITKAALTWTAGKGTQTLPTSVVFKRPTGDKIEAIPMMKEFFKDKTVIEKVHNREVDAYTYFNKYPPAPIPMARCIYREKMNGPDTGMLILETVSGRSLTFNDSNNLEQLKTLASHIASVQAYGFKHPEYQDFLGPMPFDGAEMMKAGVPASAKILREKYPNLFVVTDEQIEKGMTILDLATEFMMHPEKNPYTKIIALGDMQPNNTLWKLQDDGSLTNVVEALLDFQIAHTGTCFHDISNVVMWGVTADEHDAWMDEVLHHFYQCLKEKMGDDPMPVTFQEILDGYKVMKVTIGIMMIHMITVLESAREIFKFSQDKLDDMVKKTVTAFEDIDSPEVQDFLNGSRSTKL